MLRHLVSSLSNVIRQIGRQVGRQTKIPDFFGIQCLAFGNYSVVLNAMFGFSSPKNIL